MMALIQHPTQYAPLFWVDFWQGIEEKRVNMNEISSQVYALKLCTYDFYSDFLVVLRII